MNLNYAKNMAHCYFKLNDVEKTLVSLKSISKAGQSALKQYFMISLKHGYRDNVEWALQHIKVDRMVEEALTFMVQSNMMTKKELIGLIKNNPHVDLTTFVL